MKLTLRLKGADEETLRRVEELAVAENLVNRWSVWWRRRARRALRWLWWILCVAIAFAIGASSGGG